MNAKRLGVAMALVVGLGISGQVQANSISYWMEVGDAGGLLSSPQNVGSEVGGIKGVLDNVNDVDVFRFAWLVNSSEMTIEVDPQALILSLYDASQTLLASSTSQLIRGGVQEDDFYYLTITQSPGGGSADYTVVFQPAFPPTTEPPIGPVPEPATLALLGLGLAGLGYSRRRTH